MSLHSCLWPTSPVYPIKGAVRECAFQLAWRKYSEGLERTDDVAYEPTKEILKAIVSELAETDDLDTILIANKAYQIFKSKIKSLTPYM